MTRRSLLRGRFDDNGEEPMDGLANLVDIVLVFACGLVAVLATRYGTLPEQAAHSGGQEVIQGTEMPELPRGIGEAGSGYQSVGTVYRDPDTGKLILVGEATP